MAVMVNQRKAPRAKSGFEAIQLSKA
jgi:hypothetical protein